MINNQTPPTIVDQIINEFNFPELFKSYEWINDTWSAGFPDMFRLEMEITSAARKNSLNRDHLIQIAKWGKLPNVKRINCPSPIRISLYQDNVLAPWIIDEPFHAVSHLEHQITGFGPTYISKLLHFAAPQIFGALDTRLVRVFGKKSQNYPLFNLYATEINGRWAIPATQKGWPVEYGRWVDVLRLITNSLNRNQIHCPHTSNYIQSELRKDGIWLPADVETALFAYASHQLKSK